VKKPKMFLGYKPFITQLGSQGPTLTTPTSEWTCLVKFFIRHWRHWTMDCRL